MALLCIPTIYTAESWVDARARIGLAAPMCASMRVALVLSGFGAGCDKAKKGHRQHWQDGIARRQTQKLSARNSYGSVLPFR
jgi:hypothetical protein